jgi:hypothetical protein
MKNHGKVVLISPSHDGPFQRVRGTQIQTEGAVLEISDYELRALLVWLATTVIAFTKEVPNGGQLPETGISGVIREQLKFPVINQISGMGLGAALRWLEQYNSSDNLRLEPKEQELIAKAIQVLTEWSATPKL